jgi:hypothetical protein
MNLLIKRMPRTRSARLHVTVWSALLLAVSVVQAQIVDEETHSTSPVVHVAGNSGHGDVALEVESGTQEIPVKADKQSSKIIGNTIVGVKLLKTNPRSTIQPLQISIPADCPGCAIMHGPIYEGQNARESFFYLKVPVSMTVLKGVRVDIGDLDIRAVVVEKSYPAFHRSGNIITFDVPIQPRERSSTLEVQTSLDWPGLTIRIEHAFQDRRAGRYGTGQWPVVERQAALNLEFGLREAIRDLGLDREVCGRGLGKIHLMGFDTNDPLGHEDFPPHIHIILRWPHFAGSQAPHFYLSNAGLLRGDVKVTIDGMPQITETSFPQGATVPAIDYLGETVYEAVENANGTLTMQRPAVGSCILRPLKAGSEGFASGSKVECTTGQTYSVLASDDVKEGVLKVSVNAKPAEIYKYDPDTAVLLSAVPALADAAPTTCANRTSKQ